MEQKATSRDNPWIQALWLLGLLGLVVAVGATYFGYAITTKESDFDPALGPLLMDVGVAVGAAALVALALGFAVCARLWEHRNNT